MKAIVCAVYVVCAFALLHSARAVPIAEAPAEDLAAVVGEDNAVADDVNSPPIVIDGFFGAFEAKIPEQFAEKMAKLFLEMQMKLQEHMQQQQQEGQQQDGQQQESQEQVQDSNEENAHSRQKRATCDLLSATGINHTACAAHCLLLGKRGGYCNNRAVCVCRN